jgi:hypothetical protein
LNLWDQLYQYFQLLRLVRLLLLPRLHLLIL